MLGMLLLLPREDEVAQGAEGAHRGGIGRACKVRMCRCLM